MEQPLVSVVTITRNRGPLLARCINSVLSQTYTNIEHIVVDGASTDNTDEVIASFKDSRLKFIKLEDNWPVVKTINYGVDISKGQFVTFLDSDDEYAPTKIEKQLNLIMSLPEEYGMVYCWMTYFNEATKEIDHIHNPQLRGFVGDDNVETPIVSGTPTYFFRKQAFIENGGWRDDIGIISDWEMVARFCQKWKVDFVPESLINVYINHGLTRMSENTYYKNQLEKEILFSNAFLIEFEDIFKRYPRRAANHLYLLSRSLFLLKRYSEAWPYYLKLMQYRHSIKDILLIPFCLIKKIK